VLVLIDEKVFHAGEQEVAEATALRGGVGERVLLQDALEETLSEILGVLLAPALRTDVGIHREPVVPAEVSKGGAGTGIIRALAGGDDAPTGGGKGGTAGWIHARKRCSTMIYRSRAEVVVKKVKIVSECASQEGQPV